MSIKKILLIGYTSWCGLGFIRGVNYYKFEKEKPYIYSNLFIGGLCGTIIYGAPIFLPFTFYKELYRLEVNIRQLESEKNSKYYIDII